MFSNQAPRPAFGTGTSTYGTNFSAPATTRSGFVTFGKSGGFGTPLQNTNFGIASTPFGATMSMAGSLFGGQTVPASCELFGQQNQPALGFAQTTTGFGNTEGTSLFDQTQQPQTIEGANTGSITDATVNYTPVTDTGTMTRNGVSNNIETSIEVISSMMCQISIQTIDSTKSSHGTRENSELLKNCHERAWPDVARLLKHSTHYDKEILTEVIMISKSDSQWGIIGLILMKDVCFDMDVIKDVINEAVLEKQHDFIAFLGSIYGKVNVFSQALLYCEDRCNWEMIMTILNISLDIHVSVLNKVLMSASHHQEWHIVHNLLQSNVEFSDLALERVLDLANLNGKLNLIEVIAIRYSRVISDKILLQATIHQQWKFIIILLKSQKEFRKETLEHVFTEAFINLDRDIMQYYFTQNYSEELLDFGTLITVFGKIYDNEQELSRNVAFLLDAKVNNIIYPFKMNTCHNSLGSIWSHYLDGNIQVAEICKHSVIGYCRLERHGCPYLHATANVHWQISFTQNYWINLTKQQSQCIEEAFCNPNIDHCYPFHNSQLSTLSTQEKGIMSLLGHENWVVDFKYNKITNDLKQCNANYIKHKKYIFIRRLAVKDSVANQYQWYFKENNGLWVKYANRGNMGENARLYNRGNDGISSDTIEQFYLKILNVSTNIPFDIFFNKTHYHSIDFNKMEEINKNSGMKRLVKRRPKKHLILSLLCHKEIIKTDDTRILVNVEIPAEEYKEIFEKLQYTLSSDMFVSHIESVEKVNNTVLQRAYKLRLEMMEAQYENFCAIRIKKVLHGTKKEFVEKIIHENFDWHLNGKSNGKAFGQGVYFTSDPKKALNYAKPDLDGKRYLIISSIIVGCKIVGNPHMEKPPINPDTNLPYDTSVNKQHSIYVKYNKQEYCPEYVVTITI